MIRKEDLPPCPVVTTLQIIGSKWKLYILQELEQKPMRFGELQRALSGISKHVLNATLKSMRQDGIILRTVLAGAPVRVEYSLSGLGESLRPVLEAMKAWGLNISGHGAAKRRRIRQEGNSGFVKPLLLRRVIRGTVGLPYEGLFALPLLWA